MSMCWYFEIFNPNGGTAARGLRRSLSGAGLEEAAKFARESVQNSNDAKKEDGEPVEFIVRLRHITGDARKNLLELTQLISATGPAGRGLLKTLPDPLPLLFVEDFGTVGLGGVERSDVQTDPKIDRFIGLCRNFGDSAADAEGGGTFGFGKTVYWNASSSGIVLFHSRFAASKRTSFNYSRLIGGGLLDQHEYHGHRYTGRAWFGNLRTDNGSPYVAPLTDQASDHAAAALGFAPRANDNRTGTSVLVVNSHFSTAMHLQALRAGIELNYWPLIVDNRLIVRLYENDEELPAAAPADNPILLPFIDCYKNAVAKMKGDEVPNLPEGKTDLLKRYSKPLGAISLTTLTGASPQEAGYSQTEISNTVALLRKPRMVVDYLSVGQRPIVDFAGVFVADNELNPVLAKSEPPTHNRWDPAAEELPHEDGNLVRHLNTKIRDHVRQFLRDQQDEQTEKPTSCPDLGRELAKLLSIPGESGPGPTATPVSITYVEDPHLVQDNAGSVRVETTVQIEIPPATERQSFGDDAAQAKRLEVAFKPWILLDGGERTEALSIHEIEVNPPHGAVTKDTPLVEFQLPEHEFQKRIRVLTGPRGHDEQTVDIEIVAVMKH